MIRDWIPYQGEQKVVQRFEKLQDKHLTFPAAIGISLSKTIESGVLVAFGVANLMNLVAWVVSFFIFFALYIISNEL
jgi:uncharacterized membrane protein